MADQPPRGVFWVVDAETAFDLAAHRRACPYGRQPDAIGRSLAGEVRSMPDTPVPESRKVLRAVKARALG